MFDTDKVLSLKRFKAPGHSQSLFGDLSEYNFDAERWFGKSCPPVLSSSGEVVQVDEASIDDFMNPFNLQTDYDKK